MTESQKTDIGLRAEKYTIFLVDDDSGIRTLLRKLLERQHYEVIEAIDGMEALQKIDGVKVDCVITDVMMPRLSGVQLLGELRKRCPLVPVIIITGKPAIEAAVECMKNGAFDYISKPFEFEQIR
ncbi:MAG: response regulator, partial [Lentisphaerae bacterium]